MTLELSYDELIEDWDRFSKAYQSTLKSKKYKIRDHDDLEQTANYIVNRLADLGWENIDYDSVQFKKINGSWIGEAVKGNVYLSDSFRDSPDIDVYSVLTHEIMHTSKIHDEPATEIYSVEAVADLGYDGDLRFEAAAYARVMHWISQTIELKSRIEGVPKEYKKRVKKIQDYYVEQKYSRSASFYNYGYGPYSLVKDALKKNKKSIKTKDGRVWIDSIRKMWDELD